MPTIICDTCGVPFHVRPSRVGIRRRCSIACKDTRQPITCEGCGVVFLRAAWHRNAGWNRTFCSVACSRLPHTATHVGTQARHALRWDRLENWSPDLAYFVGLMLSDGNVRDTGAVGFVSLDRCSTEFVRDYIAPDSPIREERTKLGTIAFRWTVWSRPLVDRLGQLGIHPRKSLTVRMPPVPDDCVWDFLRGLLDGDGHVDRNGRASFATGSGDFATDLVALFARLGLKATAYGKGRSYSVQLNVAPSRHLASLMYRPDAPHLERKRVRFR